MKEINQKFQYDYLIENAWLGLELSDLKKLKNPLITKNRFLMENPDINLLWLFKQPEYCAAAVKYILNVELTPKQAAVLNMLMTHSFPFLIAARGWSKTYLMAVLCLLKAVLNQGIKIVGVGSGLRQSKHIYDYCCKIYYNAPILRSLINAGGDDRQGPKFATDRYTIIIGESTISFLPIGDGEKIRGERANLIFVDELQSQNPEILERVVFGFGTVLMNPMENFKAIAKYEKLKEIGEESEEPEIETNQIILSGTAYYQFNHIYQYYQRYKNIISNKVGNTYKEHCVIRIPSELSDRGFMDAAVIEKAKEGGITGVSEMEYGAVFSKDSNGFYRASVVNGAVAKLQNNINLASCKGPIEFHPVMRGNRTMEYVISIDPASQDDDLSVAVLEIWPDHLRTVYAWSTNKKDHNEQIKEENTDVKGYYAYCARHIRKLSRIFPTRHIGIDTQGGGYAIMEAWNEEANMEKGDKFWWPIIDMENPQDTDSNEGDHIIYPIAFAKEEWTYNANHNLKKDLESHRLLFAYSNPIDYAIAGAEPNKGVETIEDVMWEIEEMKGELIIIEHSRTPSGRDKWDVPKIKSSGMKKGRLRKDRYSALLIGNSIGRELFQQSAVSKFDSSMRIGGTINDGRKFKGGRLFNGPDWFTKAAEIRY